MTDCMYNYKKFRWLLTCTSAHIVLQIGTGEAIKGEHSVLSEVATSLIGCTVEADSLESRVGGALWMMIVKHTVKLFDITYHIRSAYIYSYIGSALIPIHYINTVLRYSYTLQAHYCLERHYTSLRTCALQQPKRVELLILYICVLSILDPKEVGHHLNFH